MKTDKDRLQLFYQNYLKDYPDGGGWPNIQIAFESYQASTMSKLIPWQSINKIIDVGSGAGNFLSFLRSECNYLNRYTGVEMVDFFHDLAINNYASDPLAEFAHADFMDMTFNHKEQADWVFCIGALGTMQSNKKSYDADFIKKLRSIADRGMTLHLNDDRYFNPARLQEVPDLVAHNIKETLAFLSDEFQYKDLQITTYPTDLTSCAITLLFY